MLAHWGQTQPNRLRTKVRRAGLIFGFENSLPGSDERQQCPALAVLEALLVHGELEVTDEHGDLLDVVLHACSESTLVRFACEESVVANLIGSRQREAGVIRVAIDLIELDSVESLASTHVESPSDDRSE